MSRKYHLAWMAVLAVSTSAGFLYWSDSRKSYPNEKEIQAAQDEVYEVIVRELYEKAGHASLLVFSDTLTTGLMSVEDQETCKERIRKQLILESGKIPYDSWADKVYRILTHSHDDYSLGADTVQDYANRSCTEGRLPQTFHTKLSRKFISRETVNSLLIWMDTKDAKKFAQRFPGAEGVISFSSVGFDRSLDEAIVSSSSACGWLCGAGGEYVLKKKRGCWEIVGRLGSWIS